tara:strand:- start:286 stop:687 length:402 start_codon:yes stop_codon:yes gene_type:complete
MIEKKFLKKIIAQNIGDLRVISALAHKSKVQQTNIKYLKKNKIFLLPIERIDRENIGPNKIVNSIIKFDFIEKSKSKNIDQKNKRNILELLAIEQFKRNNLLEITLLFSNNAAITLSTELIDVTLEDITNNDD